MYFFFYWNVKYKIKIKQQSHWLSHCEPLAYSVELSMIVIVKLHIELIIMSFHTESLSMLLVQPVYSR